MRHPKLSSLVAALVLAVSGTVAHAQAPVRMIAGFPPGGAVDILARVFAERLAEGIGRPVVVENRPGAGGQIAMEVLKAAAPDGNTLLVTPDSNMTVYPHTVAKPVYDAFKDFTPIAHTGNYDLGFGISANVPARDLREFVAWAKANPDKASYGSGGAGTVLHFYGLMIAEATGAPLIHVPYKGVGPAVADVAAGQIPAVILPLGILLPQVKAGKARLIVNSGAKRSQAVPDLPTTKEMGYRNLEVAGWFGIIGPGGMRADMANRLNEIFVAAQRTPAIRERMRNIDMEIQEMTQPEFAAKIRADYEMWRPIIKASGFTADSK